MDGGDALFSCAKDPPRSPSLFWQATYNPENKLQSLLSQSSCSFLLVGDLFGWVLNKGSVFLGKVLAALCSEPP